MRLHGRRVLTFLVPLLVCSAALVSVWAPRDRGQTDDRNGDGRPDVWRSYTRDGRIATVAVDTNFDGRSDVQEFYADGALVRRESDRDFNDRVDLIQEFDQTTQQIVRSVVDVNSDGVADLLVLFQDGRPVYSKWAQAVQLRAASLATAARTPDQPLVALVDPFSADVAVKAVRVSSGVLDSLGLSVPAGVPQPRIRVAARLARSFSSGFDVQPTSHADLLPSSPRGPPALTLFS